MVARACPGAAKALELAALNSLVLHKLEDCTRSGFQNCCLKNVLAGTKLCYATLCSALLVHGYVCMGSHQVMKRMLSTASIAFKPMNWMSWIGCHQLQRVEPPTTRARVLDDGSYTKPLKPQ